MAALVWVQREFRVDYLPALQVALENHEKVIVAYFHDSNVSLESNSSNKSSASQAWLYHALKQLQLDYQQRDGQLWIVQGTFNERFKSLLETQNIEQVYYSFQVGELFSAQQEQALEICTAAKVGLTPFFSEDFFEPSEVKNLKGSPYLVFTPFYKNCIKQIGLLEPQELSPKSINKTKQIEIPQEYKNLPKDLQQIADKPWAKKMLKHWQIGEQAAWHNYDLFLERQIQEYDKDRDFPAIDATSRLSPYLHFGHVSPISLYLYIQGKLEQGDLSESASQPWVRQLFWRSFARYLLVWFPNKEKREFNDKYSKLHWQQNAYNLKAWQQGLTGIPIVDAGMRELWETGTMHNRVRMLVASLLTKNLNIDWREGLNWFEHTLFDADPANNSMGWQWVAGCGVDAAPYYRLFNPVVQSQKFDKQGEYIKKWLPELKALSSKAIHEPWNHIMECQMKNIALGTDYPQPIVDLKRSREQHLQRVDELKTLVS